MLDIAHGVLALKVLIFSRYIAVCRPLKYREFTTGMSPLKRAVIYILPVSFLAILFNIPKFLEIQVCMLVVGQMSL